MNKLQIFIAAILYTPVFIWALILYAIGWLGYPYMLVVHAIMTRTFLFPKEYSDIIGKPLDK